MNHRTGLKICSLLLVLALIFSFACAPTEEGEQPEKVITIGTMLLPHNFNPMIAHGNVNMGLIAWMYDSLYEIGPEDVAQPNLAKEIVVSPDGLTYTITIRDNATFWDGTPLTAEDVVFSYDYIVGNELAFYAQMCTQVKEWKVIDDYVVEMTLKKALNRSWLNSNTFYWIPIVPKHVWQDITPEEALLDLPLEKTRGSGPYQVVEFAPDEYIKLRATPFAKEVLGANIDEYILKGYADGSVMINDFIGGKIDAIYGLVSYKAVPALEAVPEVSLAPLAALAHDFVVINSWSNAYARGEESHPHPALKDVRVREALDWALDEEVATEISYGKYGTPGCQFLMYPYFGDFSHTELDCRGFDLDKARQILDEAGYLDTDGDGIRETAEGLPLRFDVYSTSNHPNHLDVATVWAREVEKIGIKLDNSVMAWETVWSLMIPDGEYDIVMWEWPTDPDPHYYLSGVTCSLAAEGGWSVSGYCNPEVDEWYVQAEVAPTREERAALYWKMQEAVHRDIPFIVYDYFGNLSAFRNDTVDMDVEFLKGLGSYGPASKMFAINADTVK